MIDKNIAIVIGDRVNHRILKGTIGYAKKEGSRWYLYADKEMTVLARKDKVYLGDRDLYFPFTSKDIFGEGTNLVKRTAHTNIPLCALIQEEKAKRILRIINENMEGNKETAVRLLTEIITETTCDC
jgi:hypothetical protein